VTACRVYPDDAVYKIHSVYLGPPGFYIGAVRVLALAVGLCIFLACLVVEHMVTGHVPVPPLRDLLVTMVVTGAVMEFVTPEVPLGSLFLTLRWDLTVPRAGKPSTVAVHVAPKVLA
jgi:hypothetical protein